MARMDNCLLLITLNNCYCLLCYIRTAKKGCPHNHFILSKIYYTSAGRTVVFQSKGNCHTLARPTQTLTENWMMNYQVFTVVCKVVILVNKK